MRSFIKLNYYCIRYKILYKYLMLYFEIIKKYSITLSDKNKHYLERKLKKLFVFSVKVIKEETIYCDIKN